MRKPTKSSGEKIVKDTFGALTYLVEVRGFEPPTPASRRPVQRAKLLNFSQRSPVFQALSPIKPAKFRFGRFIEPQSTVL